jgi:hypothetical protein
VLHLLCDFKPVREAEGKSLALTFRPLHEANPWCLFAVILPDAGEQWAPLIRALAADGRQPTWRRRVALWHRLMMRRLPKDRQLD